MSGYSVIIIQKTRMFRFYLSSQYRKLYNQLTSIQILSDSMTIQLEKYQEYFHHRVIVDPTITKHLQLISKEKLSFIKCVKIVVFLHSWMQATCVVEDGQAVLEFINFLFKQVQNLSEKTRRKGLDVKQLSKSAVLGQAITHQQLELSKQLFILQEVLPPYLYYLQKMVSIFDFYNTLKKNFIKSMNSSEIWVLINLIRCVLKISNKIPAICKFIKKSYRPIAEGLTYTLVQDLNYFYPKLYKYCYAQAAKLRSCFFDWESKVGEEQAFKKTIEGVESMFNILQEVLQINKSLKVMINEPIVQQLDNLYFPKTIDVNGNEFQMIFKLNILKKSGYPSHIDGSLNTPKFLILNSSKSLRTEEKDEEELKGNLCIFRDLSNENEQVMTFRKQKPAQKTNTLKCRLQPIKQTEAHSVY